MIMKEADILNKVLNPIILKKGYENNEVDLNYLITSNIAGGEIRFRPDIVLLNNENDKNPLLVIELKSSLTKSRDIFEKAIEQTLFYSNEIGLPIFAITDGISFYLFANDKSILAKIDSIQDESEKLEELLSKGSLLEFIRKIKLRENSDTKLIELEKEWLNQIDEEALFLDDTQLELKYTGAKVVGYIAEKVFEKFCSQEEIPFRSTNLTNTFDYIIGSEKIEIKATLVHNKSKKYRLHIRHDDPDTTIIFIAIHVDLDDDAILGYNFKQAEIVGYINTKDFKKLANLSITKILQQSDLLPINNWIEGVKGGISK